MLSALKTRDAERRAAHPLAIGGVVVGRGVAVAVPTADRAQAWDVGRLARAMMIVFRRHPHLNNVLTHLCGADWGRLDAAIRAVLDPAARARALSPLALNLLDLMCAERGVTGRIMKPHVRDLLATLLPPDGTAAVTDHLDALFLRAQSGRRI